jgi:hypothetical protein
VLWIVVRSEAEPMISSVETRKGTEAITSDRWHVVHSRFVGESGGFPFRRSIASEHDDRASSVRAARSLVTRLRRESGALPIETRDQVFVRRPGFKSVKSAKRRIGRVHRTDGGDA